jgi:hypothetical protein
MAEYFALVPREPPSGVLLRPSPGRSGGSRHRVALARPDGGSRPTLPLRAHRALSVGSWVHSDVPVRKGANGRGKLVMSVFSASKIH